MRKHFGLVTIMSICLLGALGCQSNHPTSKDTTTKEPSSSPIHAINKEETTVKEELRSSNDISYQFSNASVHDPSVIKVNGTYYVFGSHLSAAKSNDLINWTQIASGVNSTNPLITNVKDEVKEALTWAQTDTLWAPDVIQLEDGRFYMYYCACRGDAPISALGIAVSDTVEGPYEDLGIILKSGMEETTPSENGDVYNASIQPNVVDPDVFFDKDGRLWMVYGSYSGGIYILELNPKTGFPLEKGYGKKLLGENHLRIEGPYILYSPESDYYYMFLSFGGLDATGGYNIRVARSKNPDGPYYDSAGNNLLDCKGPAGTFFDDTTAAQYGDKILGNIKFQYIEGENGKLRNGYVSPGHNSAIYNEESGEYFLIFHTRFENRGEAHEVRTHQMFLNEEGWFVVSPYRYVGEKQEEYTDKELIGQYKYINQLKDISSFMKKSQEISLNEDYTISGKVEGTWKLMDGNQIELTIQGTVYKGIVTKQWDEYGLKNVMVFSAISEEGVSVLGSGLRAIE